MRDIGYLYLRLMCHHSHTLLGRIQYHRWVHATLARRGVPLLLRVRRIRSPSYVNRDGLRMVLSQEGAEDAREAKMAKRVNDIIANEG